IPSWNGSSRSARAWLSSSRTWTRATCTRSSWRSSSHGAWDGASSSARSVPASMSSDEAFVEEVLRSVRDCGIEAIVIGSVAALLQGAPITTEDMDILVRDTPRNREKLKRLEELLGRRAVQISPLTRTLRIPTPRAHVDILFDEISGKLRF